MADEIGRRAAFAANVREPSLRRVQLALLASLLGHVSIAVAIAVYAYDVGGASAVSLVYVLRLVPAAIATPFASVLGDRYSRAKVMLLSNASRFVLAVAIPPAILAGASHWLVYLLSVGVAVAGTPFRPAQVAILPSLVDRPQELTAANVVSSTIEGASFFLGPAIAGVLLAVATPTAVFWFVAICFRLSTIVIIRPAERGQVDRELGRRGGERRAGDRRGRRDDRQRTATSGSSSASSPHRRSSPAHSPSCSSSSRSRCSTRATPASGGWTPPSASAASSARSQPSTSPAAGA